MTLYALHHPTFGYYRQRSKWLERNLVVTWESREAAERRGGDGWMVVVFWKEGSGE